MADKNNAGNVSVGKGVSGGYAFSAPLTATVPTDYKTALPEEFVNLGFITEDGIEFSLDADTEDYYDLNGDPYESAVGTQTEEVVLTLAEIMKNSAAEAFGHNNVTDEDGTLKIRHNSNLHDERIYVFELLLKNGRKWRCVVPRGKASRSGSTTVANGDIVGYEITIKCAPNADGDRMLDYIESTSVSAMSLSLENMSKDQLIAEAVNLGVDVSPRASKAEIVQAISEKAED